MKKIRGFVGNILLLVFSVAGLAFMALPWSASRMWVAGEASEAVEGSSVFDVLGNIGDASGTSQAALVFFLLFAIFACIVALTSIVSLVGVIIGNKKLNLTFYNRILSLVLLVFGLIAMICSIAYFADFSFITDTFGGKSGTETIVNGGAILPMICGLLALVSAFIAPSKKKS